MKGRQRDAETSVCLHSSPPMAPEIGDGDGAGDSEAIAVDPARRSIANRVSFETWMAMVEVEGGAAKGKGVLAC